MDLPPFTAIARAVRTHGVSGELSCTPLEGALEDLPVGLELWFVPPPGSPLAGRLENVRPGPKGTIVKVSGVDTVEHARELQGTLMLAATHELPEGWLAPAEPDPVGLSVTDTERGYLGRVVETIVTGANDVWIVESDAYGQLLIPVIEQVVLDVDEDARSATVRLLPGLIDED